MEVDNGPCPLTIVLQWNGHVMVISCMQLSQSEKDPHVCVCGWYNYFKVECHGSTLYHPLPAP